MALRYICILVVLLLSAAILWLLHARLLLPIRSGPYTETMVVVTAHGDASELEMLLRGLIWLRDNGVVPCSICVADAGLTAEARAALICYARDKNIMVCEERGTDIHG